MDSNQRKSASKAGVLPLDDTPKVVPPFGLEPNASRLQGECSTCDELQRQVGLLGGDPRFAAPRKHPCRALGATATRASL